jgi:predicted O-methyltransferase YrrM
LNDTQPSEPHRDSQPDDLAFKRAPPYWRDNPFAQQTAAEIGRLQGAIHAMGGMRSYLEIGCSFGWSMFLLAEVMLPKAKIRGIDLGYIDEVTASSHSHGYDTKPKLEEKVQVLRERGFDVEIFYGDSHSLEAIQWARKNGPYQLVMIDGDHSYEGVRADWENYGHLGECVAFHDIAHKELGVIKLWQELSSDYNGRSAEFVCPMGIGVINRCLPNVKQPNEQVRLAAAKGGA